MSVFGGREVVHKTFGLKRVLHTPQKVGNQGGRALCWNKSGLMACKWDRRCSPHGQEVSVVSPDGCWSECGLGSLFGVCCTHFSQASSCISHAASPSVGHMSTSSPMPDRAWEPVCGPVPGLELSAPFWWAASSQWPAPRTFACSPWTLPPPFLLRHLPLPSPRVLGGYHDSLAPNK